MVQTLVVLLAASALAVPVSRRLGLGSVLGYVVAGIAIGPNGLRLVTDVEQIAHVSELGVVMLPFLIGLELRRWQVPPDCRCRWAPSWPGVLLSGSECRYELRADIEPFEDLLLGFFFISVGMSAGLALALHAPGMIVAAVAGLLAAKAAAGWVLARSHAWPRTTRS